MSKYGFDLNDEVMEVIKRKGQVLVHFEADNGSIITKEGRFICATKRFIILEQKDGCKIWFLKMKIIMLEDLDLKEQISQDISDKNSKHDLHDLLKAQVRIFIVLTYEKLEVSGIVLGISGAFLKIKTPENKVLRIAKGKILFIEELNK